MSRLRSPAPATRRRAAVYVRISADREGRELGVARQEQDCRQLADRLDCDVVAVYRDNDLSASTRSRKPRPNWQEMLASVDAGHVEVILAYSTSRLTRRPREFEDLIDRAERGTVIATVRAGDLDLNSARGRFQARQDANRDAAYAEEISELAKRAKQQRREAGLWHGGNRPFGWDADGCTPRPVEQRLLAAACEAVLTGRTVAAIARDWDEAGAQPPQRATSWSGVRVSEMLRAPRMAGLLPDGRPAVWTGVVPEATWRAVLAILSDPARRRPGGPLRLLTGLAHCHACGSHVRGGVDRHGRPTYRCATSKHLDRLATPIDRYVTDVVLRMLSRREVVSAGRGGDIGRLATEAAVLRGRFGEAEDLFADGTLDGPGLKRVTTRLRGQLGDIEVRLTAAAGSAALAGVPLDEPGLHAYWEQAEADRRRALIRAVDPDIRISSPGRGRQAFDPATVTITAKAGPGGG